MIKKLSLFISCLVFAVVGSGCAAARILAGGTVRIGVRSGLVSAAEAAAATEALGGIAVRGLVAGEAEVIAAGALSNLTLRTTLAGLAQRSGLRLAFEGGGITIGGSRIVIAESGAISLRSAGAAPRVLGRIESGLIYDLTVSPVPTGPIGTVRVVAKGGEVRALTSPSVNAPLRGVLRPGTPVEVVRVRSDWFEIRIGGQPAWVPSAEVLVVLAACRPAEASPGPWRATGSQPASAAASFVLEQFDRAACSSARTAFQCFDSRMPGQNLLEQHPQLTGYALTQPAARVLWESSAAAVVEVRERFLGMLDDKVRDVCSSVLVTKTEDIPSGQQRTDSGSGGEIRGPHWTIVRRGPWWTCDEPNPYLQPLNREPPLASCTAPFK